MLDITLVSIIGVSITNDKVDEYTVNLPSGEKIRIKKGKNGRFYPNQEARRWDKTTSTYAVSVLIKTLKPDIPILTYDVCKGMLKLLNDLMHTNGGSLEGMYTNNVDTLILDLMIHRNISPAKMIGTLKSYSSRFLKNDPKLKRQIIKYSEIKSSKRYGTSFWGSGYELYSSFMPEVPDTFVEIEEK